MAISVLPRTRGFTDLRGVDIAVPHGSSAHARVQGSRRACRPRGRAARIRLCLENVLEGPLTMDDAGRQRAYGRGFIRLEPLALERAA
jgi:hypothetical protein